MNTMLFIKELSQCPVGTFADIIFQNALLFPVSEAFVRGPQRITSKDYNKNVNRIGPGLERQVIRKEDNTGVLFWNSAENGEVSRTALEVDFVFVLFNPHLKPNELIHQIENAKAKVLCVGLYFVHPAFNVFVVVAAGHNFRCWCALIRSALRA